MAKYSDKVNNAIKDALLAAELKGWPDKSCRFWQLSLELQDEFLESAAREIAQSVNNNTLAITPAIPAIAVLMQILRIDLPTVREARLWPEVSEYFNTYSGLALSPEVYGEQFRALLRKKFSQRLDQINLHKKYVSLLLDETGIGRDRARIIKEFLLELVEIEISTILNQNLKKLADEVLIEFFSNKENRRDIEALGLVLLNAGETLLKLRIALHNYDRPWELLLWEWSDLRRFWHEYSGYELGTVIPEAKEVFSALIPHFNKAIAVDKLFGLIGQNKYRIELSGRLLEPGEFNSPDDIPLSEISFSTKSSSKNLFISDQLGLTCRLLEKYPSDIWNSSGRYGHFIWMTNKFHVVKDGYVRISSRPVISPGSKNITGYLWSGFLKSNQSVHVEKPYINLYQETSVWLSYRWKYLKTGPVMSVKGVIFSNQPDLGKTTITIIGEQVWKGEIAKKCRFIPLNTEYDLDASHALAGVRFDVSSENNFFHSEELCLPRGTFSVQHEYVCRDGDLHPRMMQQQSLDGLILIGPSHKKAPELDCGDIIKLSDYALPVGMEAFLVSGNDNVPNLVNWEGARWEIESDQPLLHIKGPRQSQINDVTVTTTGNILCSLESELPSILFEFSDLKDCNKYTLDVEASGIRWSRPIKLDEPKISLSSILDMAPLGIKNSMIGLVKFELFENGEVTGIPSYLFFVGEEYDVLVSRKGDYSQLVFATNSGIQLPITSDNTVKDIDESVSATLVFQSEDGLSGGDGVTVFWNAACRDLILSDGGGVAVGNELSIELLEDIRFDYIGSQEDWNMDLLNDEHAIATDVEFNQFQDGKSLLRYISNALEEHKFFQGDNIYLLLKDGKEPVHKYGVNISASSISMIVEQGESDETLGLSFELYWKGLPSRTYSIAVNSENTIRSESIILHPKIECSVNLSCKMSHKLPELQVLLSDMEVPIEVLFLEDGKRREKIKYVYKVENSSPDTEVLKKQIRNLLTDGQQRIGSALSDAEQFIFLIERYLCVSGELPYNADKLEIGLNKLMSLLQEGGECLTIYKTRRALLDSPEVPNIRPEVSELVSIKGLLINTLILHVLVREHKHGTLNPASAKELFFVLEKQMHGLNDAKLIQLASFVKAVTCKLCLDCDDESQSPQTIFNEMDVQFFFIDSEIRDFITE